VADQLWLVADGKCVPFEDDLDAYRKLIIRQRRVEREKQKKESRDPTPKENESAKNPQKEAEKLEHSIADMAQRRHLLEGEIAQCFSDNNDPLRLKKLNAAYAALQEEMETTETELARVIEKL
jgi:ATP-binding cassette, subfamily F, member 3